MPLPFSLKLMQTYWLALCPVPKHRLFISWQYIVFTVQVTVCIPMALTCTLFSYWKLWLVAFTLAGLANGMAACLGCILPNVEVGEAGDNQMQGKTSKMAADYWTVLGLIRHGSLMLPLEWCVHATPICHGLITNPAQHSSFSTIRQPYTEQKSCEWLNDLQYVFSMDA